MTTLLLDTHVLLWLGGEPERLSIATAIEHGLRLVTRDERMHRHPHLRPMAIS